MFGSIRTNSIQPAWQADDEIIKQQVERLKTYNESRIQFEKERIHLKKAREVFDLEKQKIEHFTAKRDIVRLNVGGERIFTQRSTLTKIPNSLLTAMFNGSKSHLLNRRADGSYFFDYNPLVFSHFLDQLRLLQPNQEAHFLPPSPDLAKSFTRMLADFQIEPYSRPAPDFIRLNVAGETVITLRETLKNSASSVLKNILNNSPNLTRDRFGRPFLDYDPVAFRYLLAQIRNQGKINDLPSASYKAMKLALGLKSNSMKTLNISFHFTRFLFAS